MWLGLSVQAHNLLHATHQILELFELLCRFLGLSVVTGWELLVHLHTSIKIVFFRPQIDSILRANQVICYSGRND